jgi:hypothetical protein
VNTAVVGTGMSALGSILALVEAGLKPTVIDAGSLSEAAMPKKFEHLRDLHPKNWSTQDFTSLIDTLEASTSKIPQKLSFGSSAAYGSSRVLYSGKKLPAYSHYLGGLSNVWGGSALITPNEEFRNWPIKSDEMAKYFDKCLAHLPYAANSSNLDKHFGKPLKNTALNISEKDKKYLDKLQKNMQKNVFVGQSRLLVNSTGENACKYCGFCMTGCSYLSIFKSSDIVARLVNTGHVTLLENHILHRVSESNGAVTLEIANRFSGEVISKVFDRVYLAAGAAESSRIILNSVSSIKSVELNGRGSCIVPLISFRSHPIQWPSVNTLPGIFIEFLDRKIGAWTHVQMSNQNELVYKAFGYLREEPPSRWRRYIAANVSTLMINDNSQYGVVYTFTKCNDETNKVSVDFSSKGSRVRFLLKAFKYTFRTAYALRIFPLVMFTKMNSQTYHLGGSFPMTNIRTKANETDSLGRLTAFENLHIVDSSTYPSIPSTTLAILLTANAWRITDASMNKVRE